MSQTAQSNDDASCSAWVCWQVKDVEDFLLVRFRPGCLPDMDGATIAALQGGGDTMLSGKCFTQGVPGIVDAFCFQLQA